MGSTVITKRNLSSQEHSFIKEAIKTGNLTQAVVVAYGEKDKNYAGVKGNRLIRKDKIKKAMAPLAKRLEEERDAIIERLKVTRSKAKYRDLIDGLDKVTKNYQLITGKATENIAIATLSESDQEKLDLLLDAQRTGTQESN